MYKAQYSRSGLYTVCVNHGEASRIWEQPVMQGESRVVYIQGIASVAYVAITLSKDGEQPRLVDGFRIIGSGMIRLTIPREQTLAMVQHTENLMWDWYHRDKCPWIPVR